MLSVVLVVIVHRLRIVTEHSDDPDRAGSSRLLHHCRQAGDIGVAAGEHLAAHHLPARVVDVVRERQHRAESHREGQVEEDDRPPHRHPTSHGLLDRVSPDVDQRRRQPFRTGAPLPHRLMSGDEAVLDRFGHNAFGADHEALLGHLPVEGTRLLDQDLGQAGPLEASFDVRRGGPSVVRAGRAWGEIDEVADGVEHGFTVDPPRPCAGSMYSRHSRGIWNTSTQRSGCLSHAAPCSSRSWSSRT